ncbi:MAG: HepT-like ribonuclease domain-containing protein [Candidatus Omnitrophota bacterium]
MNGADLKRVHHILDAVQKALQFIQNRTREDLDREEMLTLSLLKLTEFVGEAANKIFHSFRNQYPNIPWDRMIKMRNRLIHGYFDIELNIIWKTILEDFPPLIPELERILKEDDAN